MGTLHSSTSVPAMLESWRQQSGKGPKSLISHPENLSGKYVRLLKPAERAEVSPYFTEGNPALPWFGCFCGTQMLGFTDDYKKMLRDLKKANHRIVEETQLG